MAVGAGVLISSVAFELMEEAYREGGFDSPAIGLLLGALLYFAVDRAHGVARCLSERPWPRTPGPHQPSGHPATGSPVDASV